MLYMLSLSSFCGTFSKLAQIHTVHVDLSICPSMSWDSFYRMVILLVLLRKVLCLELVPPPTKKFLMSSKTSVKCGKYYSVNCGKYFSVLTHHWPYQGCWHLSATAQSVLKNWYNCCPHGVYKTASLK